MCSAGWFDDTVAHRRASEGSLSGLAKHRKLCLAKNKVEVPESNTKEEISIAVVPVEGADAHVQAPPPPPKLERQTNNAYSREEALAEPDTHEVEEDEYEKAVKAPAAPVVMKPLTRVDKLRMMARQGSQ